MPPGDGGLPGFSRRFPARMLKFLIDKVHYLPDCIIKLSQQTCEFHKCYSNTLLHVYYSGNIRISGCSQCCNRWYFTFNDAECSSPGAIDAALYQAHAGDLNKHEHGHIEGYCDGIPEGNVQVKINVGKCIGTGQALGNAYTGFGSTSRIFVEEVSPPDQ